MESLDRSIVPTSQEQPAATDGDDGIVMKPSFPSKENCKVLIIGCGNSTLGEDMMKDGWTGNITNVDFSKTVIKQMKERYNASRYRKIQNIQIRRQSENEKFPKLESTRSSYNEQNKVKNKITRQIPKMAFECADVTESLPFSDGSFDLIMCKGTLDSVLCSKGGILKTKRMMSECHRVLKKDSGVLAVVSFGAPDNRLMYFENTNLWRQVDVHKVPKRRAGNFITASNQYTYVYLVRSREEPSKFRKV